MSTKFCLDIYEPMSNYKKGELFRTINGTMQPPNHQEILNSFGDVAIANAIRETVREILDFDFAAKTEAVKEVSAWNKQTLNGLHLEPVFLLVSKMSLTDEIEQALFFVTPFTMSRVGLSSACETGLFLLFPAGVGAAESIGDNRLQRLGVEPSFLAIDHLTARRHEDSKGDGARPLRIQGLGQFVTVGAAVQEIGHCRL